MNEPIPTPCLEWEEKLAGIDLDDLSASEREALNFHLLAGVELAVHVARQQFNVSIRQHVASSRAHRRHLPLGTSPTLAMVVVLK